MLGKFEVESGKRKAAFPQKGFAASFQKCKRGIG